MRRIILMVLLGMLMLGTARADGIRTSYLWHMHQPIYWPEASTWNSGQYQKVYESIWLKANGGNWYPGAGDNPHPLNDLDQIFNKDDRVADYQYYPRNAVSYCLDLTDMGAQVSFAGALIENIQSLADAGWMGGRYPPDWYSGYREARGWQTSLGKPRMDLLGVGFHHGIAPLLPPELFRMELKIQKNIYSQAWSDSPGISNGFFPAEMCFSERIIPILAQEGFQWSFVANNHISRCCSDYPYNPNPNGDQIDPPNPADQVNPSGSPFFSKFISRGCTPCNAYPLAYQPHYAEYVMPDTGTAHRIIVVPIAMAMSWDEGYGSYGTGDIDQLAWNNDPLRPMLVILGHDGDNAYSGGFSYYNENVPNFTHQAAGAGYHPTTVETYLSRYPVPSTDVIRVEDGGWVNADGDFGSPQFINWNWPLVDAQGGFDIPGGWAEDARNWAVIVAATNRVLTASDQGPLIRVPQVRQPGPDATSAEKAWHYLLGAVDSGYMYYGTALDMEVKPAIAANLACYWADQGITPANDTTPPTIWIPQRMPYNPGGMGNGSLWGYSYTEMCRDFHIWTFIEDVTGLQRVVLKYRTDLDGENPLDSHQNETYAGGNEVSAWTEMTMQYRPFPADNVYSNPEIDFFVMPDQIADEYYVVMEDFYDVLLDYYVEAEDVHGNIARSPIQHVYVGTGDCDPAQNDVTWDPQYPGTDDPVTVYVHDAAVGGWLHWGVNAVGSDWQTPHATYWPAGSTLFQGIGPAVESPLNGPDAENRYWVTMGPFNDSAQTVQTVDFVIHFSDGSWNNNGGSDYHITIAQDPVTPTPTSSTPSPTPVMTSTPAPSPTPTPTPPPGQPTYTPIPPTPTPVPPTPSVIPSPTPSQDCDVPGAAPFMPSQMFTEGSECWLKIIACNPGEVNWTNQQLYVALEAGGQFWFAPHWTSEANYYMVDCPPGESRFQIILPFTWPANTGSGSACFWTAILDSATSTLRGELGQWVFDWN